jgi:diacylglycerol kinase
MYPVVKAFFEQSLLYNAKDVLQCSIYSKVLEFSIIGMANRNKDLRWNSCILCYLLLFAQFINLKKEENVNMFISRILLLGFHNVLNSVSCM